MMYTTRFGACPRCKYRFHACDDEDSPCVDCCHDKADNFEEDKGEDPI